MISPDVELKLQAYLDDELTPAEARQIGELLDKDETARSLVAELRNTREALSGFEEGVKLPESREFFWSKIERQIDYETRIKRVPGQRIGSGEQVFVRSGELHLGRLWASWLSGWRRFLVPAGSIAALALLGVFAVVRPGRSGGPEYETALSDPGAFTYRDYASGTTLIWLSYPAENEFADDDPDQTL